MIYFETILATAAKSDNARAAHLRVESRREAIQHRPERRIFHPPSQWPRRKFRFAISASTPQVAINYHLSIVSVVCNLTKVHSFRAALIEEGGN